MEYNRAARGAVPTRSRNSPAMTMKLTATISQNRKLLAAVCLALTVVLFVFGLWPLNFSPPNKADWSPDGKGLRFYGRAMAYSKGMIDVTRAQNSTSPEFTMELWARPGTEATRSVDRLLSLSNDAGEWLAVGQWKSSLIIRSGAQTQENGKGYREAGHRNALVKGSDTFITVTYGRHGTCIYTNGNLMKALPAYALIPPSATGPARLILGNSPSGSNYWTGTVYGLALYNRELSGDEALQSYRSWQEAGRPAEETRAGLTLLYSFGRDRGNAARDLSGHGLDLVVNPVFVPLQRTALAGPGANYMTSLSFWKDVAVNVAGFVPFGFFFSALLVPAFPRKTWLVYAAVTLLGLLVSLSIELVQVYLPTRDSSLSDLVCNVLGTLAGVAAYGKMGGGNQGQQNPVVSNQ